MTCLSHGFEVVCPDGQVRNLMPYFDEEGAQSHAKIVSDPKWDKETGRGCRLAPKPSKRQLGLSKCPGGVHTWRPVAFTHPEHGETSQA